MQPRARGRRGRVSEGRGGAMLFINTSSAAAEGREGADWSEDQWMGGSYSVTANE